MSNEEENFKLVDGDAYIKIEAVIECFENAVETCEKNRLESPPYAQSYYLELREMFRGTINNLRDTRDTIESLNPCSGG